jgi:hypothetical protein
LLLLYSASQECSREASSVSLSITIPFNTASTNGNGTTTPDAAVGFPATATRDSFFGNVTAFQSQTAPQAQLRFGGLDPAFKCNFSFFASRAEQRLGIARCSEQHLRARDRGRNTAASRRHD